MLLRLVRPQSLALGGHLIEDKNLLVTLDTRTLSLALKLSYRGSSNVEES